MVYKWHYSDTGTLEGFVNNSLSYFNVSDFPAGFAPRVEAIKPEYNSTTVCRYGHLCCMYHNCNSFRSAVGWDVGEDGVPVQWGGDVGEDGVAFLYLQAVDASQQY